MVKTLILNNNEGSKSVRASFKAVQGMKYRVKVELMGLSAQITSLMIDNTAFDNSQASDGSMSAVCKPSKSSCSFFDCSVQTAQGKDVFVVRAAPRWPLCGSWSRCTDCYGTGAYTLPGPE